MKMPRPVGREAIFCALNAFPFGGVAEAPPEVG